MSLLAEYRKQENEAQEKAQKEVKTSSSNKKGKPKKSSRNITQQMASRMKNVPLK